MTLPDDALLGHAPCSGQIPARATLGHVVEIDVLTKVHAEPSQSFSRGLKVPPFGIDEDTVVIPEEIPTGHVANPCLTSANEGLQRPLMSEPEADDQRNE